jgi:hypothetical protein
VDDRSIDGMWSAGSRQVLVKVATVARGSSNIVGVTVCEELSMRRLMRKGSGGDNGRGGLLRPTWSVEGIPAKIVCSVEKRGTGETDRL